MIHLERLTWDNYDDVLKLKVAKEQKEYIVPNSDSLIHAFFAMTENKAQIFPFGIYLGKTPVGFMMIARDVPWIEQYYSSPAKYYYIWRFMIDKRYQGNGYGKEAMLQALDFIRTVPPAGEAEYCWLSYEPENTVAQKLYASLGFEERPELYEELAETPAVLKL